MAARLTEHLLVFLLVVVAVVGLGTGMTAAQRHHELTVQLDTGTPTACATGVEGIGDACKGALKSEAGTVMRIPVAVWGAATQMAALLAALAFALALAVGRTGAAWHLLLTQGAIACIGVAGTVSFLYVGLVHLQTRCGLCLAMHGANVLYALVVLLTGLHFWPLLRPEPSAESRAQTRATLALAVGVWFIVVVSLDFYYGSKAEKVTELRARFGDRIALHQRTMVTCPEKRTEPATCLPPLTLPRDALPPDDASLVLRKAGPGEPTLVEMLDVSCPHCRKEYRERMSLVFRGLAGTGPETAGAERRGGMGARLVLWPASSQCNPRFGADQIPQCEANTALLCAFAHSPRTALDYLDAEVALAHEQMFLDRPRWLREKASAEAAACFDREVKAGYPALKKHVEAGFALRQRIQAARPECRDGMKVDGEKRKPHELFWCFLGTPSYAVVREDALPAPPDAAKKLEAAAMAADKWQFLSGCLRGK